MWDDVCWLIAQPGTTPPSYCIPEHKISSRHDDGHADYEHDDDDVGHNEYDYDDDDDEGEVDCVDE